MVPLPLHLNVWSESLHSSLVILVDSFSGEWNRPYLPLLIKLFQYDILYKWWIWFNHRPLPQVARQLFSTAAFMFTGPTPKTSMSI